jgi:hypothetical protein
MAEPERRKRRRFSMSLPVTLHGSGLTMEIAAKTRDISAAGLYVYVESGELTEGHSVEFVLHLPSEITLSESVRVLCQGRVVRIDQPQPTRTGVALQIDSYEFLGAA